MPCKQADAPPSRAPDVRQNLRAVQRALGQALAHAGRLADDVTLVAVSKRQPAAAVAALYDAGVTDFAENYLQELLPKARALAASGRRPRWHFVGALQGNKVAQVARTVDVVQSADSLRHIAGLARAAAARSTPLGIFVQVSLDEAAEEKAAGTQAARSGCAPAAAALLVAAVRAAPSLRLLGLMGVAPRPATAATAAPGAPPPRASRAAFARLAGLAQTLAEPGAPLGLSMGMSGDFSAAIAAGATMVRIGTHLFGSRRT